MADFNRIKAASMSNIESVLAHYCPNGKRQGREYLPLNPVRSDSKAGSFSINLDTAAWSDFATGDKGGDLIALVAYIEGVKQGEAAKRLSQFLGLSTEKNEAYKRATTPPNKAIDTNAPPVIKKIEWAAVLPIPNDAPPPPMHPKHGKPSMQWHYHDAKGNVLCLLYRFEPQAGLDRKQFMPLTYCTNESGKHEWKWQALPEPRPLYNLHLITKRKDDIVVVCEGEKAAEAASVLYPEAVITTMLNGSQSVSKTDWTPLKNRVVWLWADNDEAGKKCMQQVAEQLVKVKAAEIQHINLFVFGKLEAKDDAADLLARGWTVDNFRHTVNQDNFFEALKVAPSAVTSSTPSQVSNFTVNDAGVWYKQDPDSDEQAIRICSKLKITAQSRDAKGYGWGLLLEFETPDGIPRIWHMPMSLLKAEGAELRGVLLEMGVYIAPSQKARNLLMQYIVNSKPDVYATHVSRTGWHNGVFVMPDRVIGTSDERLHFSVADHSADTFKTKGKLHEWQANVSMPCIGNSRLVFAVSAAFASPLLDILGMDGGGFHYRGDSSKGKSTALCLASSVWGSGAKSGGYLQQWRTTDSAMECLAMHRSDCLLALDEIGQIDPKVLGVSIYMLGNGEGKNRSKHGDGLRPKLNWKLIFLSSGEDRLIDMMARVGEKTKAGQEVRFLDIPTEVSEQFGIYETLHGETDSSKFSDKLVAMASKYYGTPSIAYLEKLVDHLHEMPTRFKQAQAAFANKYLSADADGQVKRAASRFALVAAAGELATLWGVTGWDQGEAHKAAEICFKAWLENRGGAGNLEADAMLAQVRLFFEKHGEARFIDFSRATDDHAPRTPDRAGYRKHTEVIDDQDYGAIKDGMSATIKDTEFYVFTEVFKFEICKGLDYRKVCRLLVAKGILITDGKGFTRSECLPNTKLKTRVYRITSKVFDADD